MEPGSCAVVDEVSQDLWPIPPSFIQLRVCFLLRNAVQHSSMNCVWPGALVWRWGRLCLFVCSAPSPLPSLYCFYLLLPVTVVSVCLVMTAECFLPSPLGNSAVIIGVRACSGGFLTHRDRDVQTEEDRLKKEKLSELQEELACYAAESLSTSVTKKWCQGVSRVVWLEYRAWSVEGLY